MPECCRAGQFPAWGRLPAERRRRRWEWRLLPFVAAAAIRPLPANGCRNRAGKREQRARLPRRGLRFGAGLPSEGEIHPDSVAWYALRSLLVRGWWSHCPRLMSSASLELTLELVRGC